MKVNKNTILCLIIIVIISLFLLKDCSNNNKEGFSNNQSYTKFSETKLHNNSNNIWNDASLDQCQFKCNEDKNCVGFVRNNVSDEKRNTCTTLTDDNIGDCHSLHKGNPKQRKEASNYNTFLKTSYLEKNKDLLTKCIGDEELTLNQFVYIQSIYKPNHFISVINNNIKLGEYTVKGIDFNNHATFKSIKGLEGSGTVSFVLKDNNNEDYYLCANHHNNEIELVSINKDQSTQNERTNASFELYDGYSDKRYVSLKAFSTTDINKFIMLDNNNSSLNLKEINKDTSAEKLESATFKIANNVTNNLITKQPFKNTNTNDNINKTLKEHNNQNLLKHNKKENFNNVSGKLTLIDNNGNKLYIPLSNKLLKIDTLKFNDFINKLNDNYKKSSIDSDKDRIFDKTKIMKINISNTDSYSVKIYDYDFTKNNQTGNSRVIYKEENDINSIKDIYNNNTTTNTDPDDNIFTIKSIQVFTINPENAFFKTINENKNKNNLFNSKLNDLKNIKKDASIDFYDKYTKNKKNELNIYKDVVLKTKNQLFIEQNKLRNNLAKLKNDVDNYKLKKYAKDYNMIEFLKK
jgi:hypothetical protein